MLDVSSEEDVEVEPEPEEVVIEEIVIDEALETEDPPPVQTTPVVPVQPVPVVLEKIQPTVAQPLKPGSLRDEDWVEYEKQLGNGVVTSYETLESTSKSVRHTLQSYHTSSNTSLHSNATTSSTKNKTSTAVATSTNQNNSNNHNVKASNSSKKGNVTTNKVKPIPDIAPLKSCLAPPKNKRQAKQALNRRVKFGQVVIRSFVTYADEVPPESAAKEPTTKTKADGRVIKSSKDSVKKSATSTNDKRKSSVAEINARMNELLTPALSASDLQPSIGSSTNANKNATNARPSSAPASFATTETPTSTGFQAPFQTASQPYQTVTTMQQQPVPFMAPFGNNVANKNGYQPVPPFTSFLTPANTNQMSVPSSFQFNNFTTPNPNENNSFNQQTNGQPPMNNIQNTFQPMTYNANQQSTVDSNKTTFQYSPSVPLANNYVSSPGVSAVQPQSSQNTIDLSVTPTSPFTPKSTAPANATIVSSTTNQAQIGKRSSPAVPDIIKRLDKRAAKPLAAVVPWSTIWQRVEALHDYDRSLQVRKHLPVVLLL